MGESLRSAGASFVSPNRTATASEDEQEARRDRGGGLPRVRPSRGPRRFVAEPAATSIWSPNKPTTREPKSSSDANDDYDYAGECEQEGTHLGEAQVELRA